MTQTNERGQCVPLGHPSKSSFHLNQSNIARFWIDEAERSNGFVKFSCLYSALNALAWAASKNSRDSDVFGDLKPTVVMLTGDLKRAFINSSRDMIRLVQITFSEGMHNLANRRDDIRPNERTFRISGNRNVPLTSLEINRLQEKDLTFLSIGIIYQYRCNLVHGTKFPADSENQQVIDVINRNLEDLVNLVMHEFR